MSQSIQFTFNDGTKQVLNPTAAFYNHEEIEVSWINNKKKRRILSLEERLSRIASDLKANGFKIIK